MARDMLKKNKWMQDNRWRYKDSHRLSNRKYYNNHRGTIDKVARSEYMRDYFLKKDFGITVEEYDDMLKEQANTCKICGKQEGAVNHMTSKPQRLAVDHNHSTGKVRGLLCRRCNRVLGSVQDNTDLLEKMISYLRAI